jgi:hypothetical protein
MAYYTRTLILALLALACISASRLIPASLPKLVQAKQVTQTENAPHSTNLQNIEGGTLCVWFGTNCCVLGKIETSFYRELILGPPTATQALCYRHRKFFKKAQFDLTASTCSIDDRFNTCL